mmetsp:Transcript_9112/g.18625  ORF Transcript_9112/g.18625 Transcript_9112/m.18625 type:complete len:83 (-) Transcript_9112:37-285(-)
MRGFVEPAGICHGSDTDREGDACVISCYCMYTLIRMHTRSDNIMQCLLASKNKPTVEIPTSSSKTEKYTWVMASQVAQQQSN